MITIGQKPGSSYSDPLGLLGDCHRRIEHFLNVLIIVTDQAQDQKLDAEQKSALESALRYFREAGPKHKEDEEISLFPRMLKKPGADIKAAMAIIDSLESDHLQMDKAHRDVEEFGSRWLAGESLSKNEVIRIALLLKQMKGIYQKHIAVEDHEIYPLAGKILEPLDLDAIGQEMKARRGIKSYDL